ncbi:MAG: efflux RND transporter periplasmic adaptor subunit [Acidobacteriia bacterium]|nr:efflux RND transporter periplasmic adaptor subunit [Terriglobia bacterium]
MNWTRTGILSTALLVAAVVPACTWWQRSAPGSLLLYGNVELTQVDMAFKISGKLSKVEVDEGDTVRQGMVLARLDTTQLESQKKRDQAALAAAESLIPQLQTSIERQRATLAAETDLRRAQLAQAEARLRDLQAGSRTQEIQQARALVEETQAQYKQARQDWERAQVLYKNDDISTAQYDQYRSRLDTSAAALKQAEERLALVVEGPRKEEVEAAHTQVEQARASLQLAEASRLEVKRLEQELQTRLFQVEQARAQVAVVDAQLADAVVAAPVSGVVLVKSAETGEVLAAGTTFVTIGEMDRPWLRAYIGEQDLGRVKLGAKVKVTTDSFPGKAYWGRIAFISSEAEFTPKQIQTPEERVKLVYRIKIEVANPDHELKLNMPAEAEILLAERD